MILIFLLFTVFSIYLRFSKSNNIQECLPFFIVSICSWIGFFLYLYSGSEVYSFAIFEITSLLILLGFGSKLEKIFQLKFLSLFVLTLLHGFGGVFKHDIIFMYIAITAVIALSSTFEIDKSIKFPFVQFNIISLMKAREIVDSAFAANIVLILIAILLVYLIFSKFSSLRSTSILLMTCLWLAVLVFSLDLYFLLIALTLILSISLLENFEIKGISNKSSILILFLFLLILIPISQVSLLFSVFSLGIVVVCIFVNRKYDEGEV